MKVYSAKLDEKSQITKIKCSKITFFFYLCTKNMRLHVFNPEHDLALAAHLSNFTAPHAGRHLRADLGFLPALWASEDDAILVDNVEQARKAYGRFRARVGGGQKQFVDKYQLRQLPITEVKPWGWDLALRSFLLRYGVKSVPSEEEIETIRDLSHRKYAVELLSTLGHREGLTVDVEDRVPVVCQSLDEVKAFLAQHHRIVVKAPWSSSGRGVRFIDDELNDYQERWIQNVIGKQGSAVAEPYYNKVKDFGMEFGSDGNGNILYLGLSLFHTKNGAYIGNVIASEEAKREQLSRYVSTELIDAVKEEIQALLGNMYKGRYQGPLGIDMMIVARTDGLGFLLHPCVEINLRQTMGHVALSIPPFADGFPRVMQIALTDKYRIQIRKQ